MAEGISKDEIVEHVADIVSAYVTNNPVQAPNLPELIETVHKSLSQLDTRINLSDLAVS